MNRLASAKSVAVNPKLNVIRGVSAKLSATFRRYFGEMGRVQVNPAVIENFVAEAEASVRSVMVNELGKTGLPLSVFSHGTEGVWPPAPREPKEGEEARPLTQFWAIQPLAGRRNFMHGRLPVGTIMAHVKVAEDGTCAVSTAGVYFPIEDVLVIAEAGAGSQETGGQNAPGRLRTAGRKELKDALLLLPWSSADAARLSLMGIAADHGLHTRKTGHTLFDVIDVAGGRADLAVLTQLSPMELQVAELLMKEAGGVLVGLNGKPAAAGTADAIIGNATLVAEFVKTLG